MKKIDYIEIYVSDLKHTVDFFHKTLQFVPVAYADEERYSSTLVQQGAIRLVFTAAKDQSGSIAEFVTTHGDGVKDIAFTTDNVEMYYQLALQKGHRAVLPPTTYKVGNEFIFKATVSAIADLTHTFIGRTTEQSSMLPFFNWVNTEQIHSNLITIDHLAICVPVGDLSYYVNDYVDTYRFKLSHEEHVVTPNSGMKSKAICSENKQIKLVFVEPVDGRLQSQVSQFLSKFGGPGVQHIAFSTPDIISAVRKLRNLGLEMLTIPDEYYEIQKDKFHMSKYVRQLLQENSILFDKNEQGFLYQIFSKPVVERATLFFEIIERVGCKGFGSKNIKALFQAIEQEQVKRAIT